MKWYFKLETAYFYTVARKKSHYVCTLNFSAPGIPTITCVNCYFPENQENGIKKFVLAAPMA